MRQRLVRRLVRLYPHAWRTRYEDEFVALLDQTRLTWRDAADMARSVTSEWLRVRWVAIAFVWPLSLWTIAGAWTLGFAVMESFIVGALRWAAGLEAPFRLWLVDRPLIDSVFLGMPLVLTFGALLAAPWLVVCRFTRLEKWMPRVARLLALAPFVYAGRWFGLAPALLVGALAAGWALSALVRPAEPSVEVVPR